MLSIRCCLSLAVDLKVQLWNFQEELVEILWLPWITWQQLISATILQNYVQNWCSHWVSCSLCVIVKAVKDSGESSTDIVLELTLIRLLTTLQFNLINVQNSYSSTSTPHRHHRVAIGMYSQLLETGNPKPTPPKHPMTMKMYLGGLYTNR